MSLLEQLSAAQKQQIESWIESGADLARVQKHLNEDFELKVNYMETRFLVSDLGLEIKTAPVAEEAAAEDSEPVTPDTLEQALSQGVTVTVDEITPPHALICGKVNFSDGGKAMWYIDQSGQLGLDAEDPSYRPSEEDLQEFQQELRRILEAQQSGLA